ncbi:MAG TPA: sigma-70 family RNA polymerase sigma factor [bacterium]|nr:sigma-70 family RNA polymerase sigma factor [bacterium]
MTREDFAGLYDVQYPRVFRYLLWRLRKRDAAEEIAAEVFATALTTLQKGTEPRQIGSWLIGIADHLATRSFRKRRTEDAVVEAGPAGEQDPEELVLGRIESGMIWRCVDALSPEHQQVLLLRVIAGLSAREVGGLMGKTEEAVRSLQLRALQALRALWKEADEGAKLRD